MIHDGLGGDHMTNRVEDFIDTIDRRVADIAAACTACGACASVCPTIDVAGVDKSDPEALTAGVREILRGGQAGDASQAWARACCGSGACLTVCEHGINPRFMLTMARRAMVQDEAITQRRAEGKAAFQKMSRGVRVLSRLSLPPALHEKLSPRSHPERDEVPDLVFYTGCNMLKTPHIGLLCLDVLDALDVTYEVHGGPQSCCGVFQTRSGDTENALRQGMRTLDRFAASKTSRVLSWCPTCQIQFSETTLPVRLRQLDVAAPAAQQAPQFDMTMFPLYLVERLADLKPLLRHRVDKRVALHEHPGSPGVTESVTTLLAAIPGLELVNLDLPRVGYTLGSLGTVPEQRRVLIADRLRAAEAAGVTTLAGVYHSDHRELAAHEGQWPFEIVNYMDLLGEAMGFAHEDVFKRLKTMQNVDAIVADSAALIDAYELDVDEVREVVVKDMLGEQYLPVDRSLHAGIAGSGASQ